MILASTFEEYVRQLLKATWNERLKAISVASSLPPKLKAKLWRSALERIARVSYEDVEGQAQLTRERVANLVKFCIDGDLTASIENEVAHNDNNMCPEQIGELFNRIGIKNIISSGCDHPQIIDFFNCQNAGQASDKLRTDLTNFFNRRNSIVHAIVFGNSSGADTVDRDIELLKCIALALANGADNLAES